MAVIITDMDFPDNCHACKNSRCVKSRIPWVTATKDYRTDRHSCCPLKSIDEMIKEIEWQILRVVNKYMAESEDKE